MNYFRTKPINADAYCETGLKRVLGSLDLTLLGIGAIIGAGIFVLTGIAAAKYAGPALILSYVIAGFACAFTALAYAELAAAVGGCGSAYGYAYAGIGELIAWIIGWDLILEYSVATSAVAIGWSGYVNNALAAAGLSLPPNLAQANVHAFGVWLWQLLGLTVPDGWTALASKGGFINLPAALVILSLAILLSIGVRASAHFNAAMVLVKLLAIGTFIAVAAFYVQPANWQPFMPFGWQGVMSGAALIFFAYIGFDAVSTAAEEARNPQRDLPIGILMSLLVCTVIYIVVAALLTGIVSYETLNVPSPVADALLRLGQRWAAGIIAAGAIAGLTTVMLVLYYALTRIFLAMSRDGLLPPVFSAVNARTHTPIRVILACGVIMALIAGLLPIGEVAELVNIGTLAAFVLVCAGVVSLRYTHPDLPRPFKTPFSPVIPVLGILFCVYLMLSLPPVTWARFGVWLAVGMAIYFGYSRHHSSLG